MNCIISYNVHSRQANTIIDNAFYYHYTHGMKQYIDLINNILDTGVDRHDRTGIGSRYIWGAQAQFDLSEGFPAVTVRPVPLRWVFEETMFFLRGETQTKKLEEKGVTIWKGNTSREFLDGRNMHSYPEGDMGYGYGHQWRNFGGQDGVNLGIDQVKLMLNSMVTSPESRRHIVSAWNPVQLSETALPPCHIIQHYNIDDGKLNSLFWMRSNDVIYGLPFNIAQYALLNLIFSKVLGLEPGKLIYQCSDSHIYLNQLAVAREIVAREPQSLPSIKINKNFNNFDDILDLEWEDIEVVGYNPLPDIKNKPKMAI